MTNKNCHRKTTIKQKQFTKCNLTQLPGNGAKLKENPATPLRPRRHTFSPRPPRSRNKLAVAWWLAPRGTFYANSLIWIQMCVRDLRTSFQISFRGTDIGLPFWSFEPDSRAEGVGARFAIGLGTIMFEGCRSVDVEGVVQFNLLIFLLCFEMFLNTFAEKV